MCFHWQGLSWKHNRSKLYQKVTLLSNSGLPLSAIKSIPNDFFWKQPLASKLKNHCGANGDVHCLLAGVMACDKPVALLQARAFTQREREICLIVPITVLRRGMRVCPCVCAPVSPHPPLQTSPPSPPSLSLSHPLSCAHSLIPSRAEKAGRAAPRSGTPVLKLTHAADRPVDTLRVTGGGRSGVMEMVHQAIYSLPQYGFSDLLSSHQGNKQTQLFILYLACWLLIWS